MRQKRLYEEGETNSTEPFLIALRRSWASERKNSIDCSLSQRLIFTTKGGWMEGGQVGLLRRQAIRGNKSTKQNIQSAGVKSLSGWQKKDTADGGLKRVQLNLVVIRNVRMEATKNFHFHISSALFSLTFNTGRRRSEFSFGVEDVLGEVEGGRSTCAGNVVISSHFISLRIPKLLHLLTYISKTPNCLRKSFKNNSFFAFASQVR